MGTNLCFVQQPHQTGKVQDRRVWESRSRRMLHPQGDPVEATQSDDSATPEFLRPLPDCSGVVLKIRLTSSRLASLACGCATECEGADGKKLRCRHFYFYHRVDLLEDRFHTAVRDIACGVEKFENERLSLRREIEPVPQEKSPYLRIRQSGSHKRGIGVHGKTLVECHGFMGFSLVAYAALNA